MTAQSAKLIYQQCLDLESEALWSRDWERLLAQFSAPLLLETLDAGVQVTEASELLETAKSMRKALDQAGAHAYHRVCLQAEFINADHSAIRGCHRTIALRGGSPVLAPFESDMQIEQRSAGWVATRLFSKVTFDALPVVKPIGQTTVPGAISGTVTDVQVF